LAYLDILFRQLLRVTEAVIPIARASVKSCRRRVPNILWHVYPFLRNDREISNYTESVVK
jgi:hypothetical protein